MSETAPHTPVKPGDHVYLIDGSTYIFRAYYALPPLFEDLIGILILGVPLFWG